MGQLHSEHGALVFGFLMRLLRDRGAAEDVFQQVMLQAWQRGGDYDPSRGTPATWLLLIARSRAVDHLRRRVPEPHDPNSPETLMQADPAAQDEVDALLEQWRVAAFLDRLPREEADLLRRRFHREQSQVEIAEAVGLPLGTVKSRMLRALRRLRELMEEEGA